MIRWICSKPYKLVWSIIPVVLVSLLISPREIVTLQLHNAYFIVSILQLVTIFSIFLVVISSLYWLLKDFRLMCWISICHVLTTIISLTLFTLAVALHIKTLENDFQFHSALNVLVWITILSFGTAQLLFIFNLLTGMRIGKRKNNG